MLDLQAQEFNEKSLQLVSTGNGRTTCSFICQMENILFTLQHMRLTMLVLLLKTDRWKIFMGNLSRIDIYMADLNGNIVKQLTNSPGYDAEAVVSQTERKLLLRVLEVAI